MYLTKILEIEVACYIWLDKDNSENFISVNTKHTPLAKLVASSAIKLPL